MEISPFKFTFLGQAVLKFKVPFNYINIINSVYKDKFAELIPANDRLAGKIEKEYALYFDSDNNKKFNFLPIDVCKWFEDRFKQYLKFIKINNFQMKLNSIWINEMKSNEYNPAHTHQGDIETGLSSVMILKLPNTYGKEISNSKSPTNGKLQMMGSCSGMFSKIDYEPNLEIGDFYVFPYDLRHLVYPFYDTDETRLTLAANCDVIYSISKNRGAYEIFGT